MSKKNVRYIGLICCLGCSLSLLAQVPQLTIEQGDSLILDLGGQIPDGTAIRWERSSNLSSWSPVPPSNSPVMRFLPAAPQYFRSRITKPDCPAYYTDTVQVNLLKNWSGTGSKLNAGRSYVIPYVSSSAGLITDEKGSLTAWTDVNRKAVWYLYQQAGRYDLNFILTLTNRSTRDFVMTCSPAFAGLDFEPVTRDFSYTGIGKKDSVWVISTTFPKTGYYRYELESKNNAGTIIISDLLVKGYSTPDKPITVAPHTTDYLSSPSVHLHYSSTAPNTSGKVNDWIYQEVLVPDSAVSPIATYWESIGFEGGYMGLQHNGENHKRILFSVWDQIDADYYARIGRSCPADSLVSLVDKGDNIHANSFGNEGTGGQSYFADARTWTEGYPVKFLFNVRKDEADCSICTSGKKPTVILSAWYCAYEPGNAPEGIPEEMKGWKYIASWRRPFVNNYQEGTGSFLENFGWSNGHLVRKGYYYNTWAHNATTNTWNHFNHCYGSNTDGATGQRIDYEHGISTDSEHTDKFYMLSGGYGNTKKQSSYTLPLKTIDQFPYLKNLDLKPFADRVDQALVAEQELKDLLNSVKDKSAWTLKYYSSQAATGEGSNGFARLIIDGKKDTYWHSQWQSGGSTFPHILVFDMAEEQTLHGVVFTLSGGSDRFMKDISIGVSNTFSGSSTGTNTQATNDANWTNAWAGDAPDAGSYYLPFDQPVTSRYIRLKIRSGWGSGDPNIRINELDVF
jgi:hypothetical protein